MGSTPSDGQPVRSVDDGEAGREQAGIAAKLVDREGLDPCPVGLGEDRMRADQARDHAASVDIAEEDHRYIGGLGEAHIGDIAGAEIDLGRAPRPFDEDHVGAFADPREAFEHARQEFALAAAILRRPHRAEALPLDDDLRARCRSRA